MLVNNCLTENKDINHLNKANIAHSMEKRIPRADLKRVPDTCSFNHDLKNHQLQIFNVKLERIF